MEWLLVAACVALALVAVDRVMARWGGPEGQPRGRSRSAPGGRPVRQGGSGLLGDLIELFQPNHQHFVAEQERQRNEVREAGSAAPPFGIDLEAGVATIPSPDRLPGASPGRATRSEHGSPDMTVRSELFVSDHTGALARADARDAGRDPALGGACLELAGVDALELEVLGEVVARAVQFGTGELELQEVDLDRESLFELPSFLQEVLVELGRAEDAELPADVATEWSADEDLPLTPVTALPLVRSIVALVTAATEAGRTVYLWVGPTE